MFYKTPQPIRKQNPELAPQLEVEAERWWSERHYPFKEMDRQVEPFLGLPRHSDWLREVRKALFLSSKILATKLNVPWNTYLRMERNEDKLQLNQLAQCADAMDCELVYAIRPREQVLYSKRIGNVLLEAVRDQPMPPINQKTPFRICKAMKDQMYDPQFRKAQGWTRNSGDEFREIARFLHYMRSPGS